MGTGLPEAVGVSQAKGNGEVYCIIGDGSLMLNLQELQTISHHSLPIKIIVYNNNGYLAIKHTQESFLEKRYFGTDLKNGLSFPDLEKIASCFEIPYIKSVGIDRVSEVIEEVVITEGPILVEVITPEMQSMLFQQGYRKNCDGTFSPADLSEMKPFMDG
jgi:acetolactate synthase-1/2/3 large subunit